MTSRTRTLKHDRQWRRARFQLIWIGLIAAVLTASVLLPEGLSLTLPAASPAAGLLELLP